MASSFKGTKRVAWTARDTERQREHRRKHGTWWWARKEEGERTERLFLRLRQDPHILALYKELEIRDLIQSETSRMHGLAS